MTTNARDEKWSSWIEWSGGKCPVDPGTETELKLVGGGLVTWRPEHYIWGPELGGAGKIIAYRYKIKEPVKCLDNAWDEPTPEEEEAWQAKEKQDVIPEWWKGHKQARYLDRNGRDWIDEFAETATIDEFRGAMRFTIGKYNRRAGKKDELVKEIEKMRDYCERWLAYEAKL